MSDDLFLDLDQRLVGDLDALQEFAQALTRPDASPAASGSDAGTEFGSTASLFGRVNADEQSVEQGLAKLVLTLVDLLRRLLEKQAIRRMEAGSLTDDEIERMGETFLMLEQKMLELKAAFGLEDEDLNLNLGPLGNLMPHE